MNFQELRQPYVTQPEAMKAWEAMIERSFLQLKPPKRMTVSEWADKYRQLSPESSAEPGQWRTSRAEYLRGIMDAFSRPEVETVTLMKSARVGGTEAVNNAIGYFICQDPGPVLVVQPTLDSGRKYSKDILDPMIRDTKAIEARVSPDKSRDRSNTILHKKFMGGTFYIVGANTPVAFRQISIRYLVKDDFDGFPQVVGNEGDPGRLADKRTQTFYNRKIANVSTPTITGLSRIEEQWGLSNQSHYLVPCPLCGHFQKLVFSEKSIFSPLTTGSLKFDKENLSWCYYECANCRGQIQDHYKDSMVRAGRWEAQKPEITSHAGYHISQLYSPWSTWRSIVEDFLRSVKERDKLRTFINVTLGETFKEDESIEYTGSSLLQRIVPTPEDSNGNPHIPEWVLFLTAGVDVQHDRLEVKVKGWGMGFESCLVDRRVVYGAPTHNSTWKALDDFLNIPRVHAPGLLVRPGDVGGLIAVGVDSGYSAQQVYDYIKPRQGNRYFATKGDAGFDKNIVHKVTFDKKKRSRLLIMGVDSAKQIIYDRLHITEDGPGKMHFNQRADAEYFEQLISERIVIKRVRGYPKKMWELPAGKRNEALDCEVICLAVAMVIRPDFKSVEAQLQEKIAQTGEKQEEVEPQTAVRRRIKIGNKFMRRVR